MAEITLDSGLAATIGDDTSFSDLQTELGLSSLSDVAAKILDAQVDADISNVTYTGSGEAAFFIPSVDVDGFVPLGEGFFLSSGGLPGDSNTQPEFSVEHGEPGDSDLDAVATSAFGGAGATQDASVLEFNLNVMDPNTDGISFDLVFGSEEFPEYSSSSFVDVAAVFVNGQNVALFNDDPTTPLSVIDKNLINENFIDNTGGAFPIEWDGFSQVLTVRAALDAGENTIKIGVADTGDGVLDSGLFVTNIELLGGGATGGGVLIVNDGSDGDDDIEAGLSAEEINLFGGQDKVKGDKDELNNDIITNFGTDDVIVVDGAMFSEEDIQVTFGSAILDIDTDDDGEPDLKITLEGEFEGAEFVTQTTEEGTEINVLFPNTAPSVVDDSGSGFETDEDTAFTTASVLANDSDDDGDDLTLIGLDTSGTLGLVTDNGDGTFNYDPDGQFDDLNDGETATDTFIYTVSDGNGGESLGQVTVVVNGLGQDAGNTTVETKVFDDGRVRETTFVDGVRTKELTTDASDVRAWDTQMRGYAPNGEVTRFVNTLDDGRVKDLEYSEGIRSKLTQTDPNDSKSWSEIIVEYDGSGTVSSKTTTFDDGRVKKMEFVDGVRSTLTQTDVDDVKSWAETVTNFGPDGFAFSKATTFDNGLTKTIEYVDGVRSRQIQTDPDDVVDWLERETLYNDEGSRTTRITTFDDGTVEVDTFAPLDTDMIL
ncbi:choice-of-anchor L domain-containing protein [Shimia sp. R10_1]|uniref:choice-of-anchor L domain-containing protein n=1 Tax=Shimia sp. R10_1 TaxID=2821095 RepID=UPI001ADBF9D4|nr:choice-of-anchor L domain-containing protein [Shimia sp. R10_1]MBO9471916.1 choice-of-anchor L domain-containing protein [Shimia sp. R10_1]